MPSVQKYTTVKIAHVLSTVHADFAAGDTLQTIYDGSVLDPTVRANLQVAAGQANGSIVVNAISLTSSNAIFDDFATPQPAGITLTGGAWTPVGSSRFTANPDGSNSVIPGGVWTFEGDTNSSDNAPGIQYIYAQNGTTDQPLDLTGLSSITLQNINATDTSFFFLEIIEHTTDSTATPATQHISGTPNNMDIVWFFAEFDQIHISNVSSIRFYVIGASSGSVDGIISS